MADDETRDVTEGQGWAVANVAALGEGGGFRKIRSELGVSAFGVNALVLTPGAENRRHFHDRQQELYFVHQGQVEFVFGDGERQLLGPGGIARVDAQAVRQMRNPTEEDAVVLIVGGADGYVGRDGRQPED